MWRKCVILILAAILLFPILTACKDASSDMGEVVLNESSVKESKTTGDFSQTGESSAAAEITQVPEEEADLTSTAVITSKSVEESGQLQIIGTNLCDSKGEPIQLKGMSLHGLNYVGDFISQASVGTLAEDWGCSVIRLPLYTESDCYIRYPDKYYEVLCDGIDQCIEQGIYVIVDWHILSDGNPATYLSESLDLFSRISEKYGEFPNILYEICNEPNSGHLGDASKIVTWERDVKPYAEEVVAAIRENDPDNIIIIGNPDWSQQIDVAAADPVEGNNIMYTVHFYAGSHGQELRDKMDIAMELGAAIFVTEWGTTNSTGGGSLYLDESDLWLDYLDANMISWCNWSIGSSIAEKSNALKMASSILTPQEKAAAHWPDKFITSSGLYVRSKLLDIPYQES